MSAQDGLLVSSHPSRCVSTIRRTRGSPISGTDSGGGDPDVQTLTFPPAPTGSASTVSCSPPSPSPTRVNASTSDGSDAITAASPGSRLAPPRQARVLTGPRNQPPPPAFGRT